MENAQKALIMAGSVFMFVIAVSVAIFSYQAVTDVIDTIMTFSENNSRTAEYFIADDLDVERCATRAEVIVTILKMKDNDYVAGEVIVDGTSYKRSDDTVALEEAASRINEGNYDVSYKNFSGTVTVVFSKVS